MNTEHIIPVVFIALVSTLVLLAAAVYTAFSGDYHATLIIGAIWVSILAVVAAFGLYMEIKKK